MRFIRKGGRVIPIRENRDGPKPYSAAPEYQKTAKIAAVGSAFRHAAQVSAIRKSKKGMVISSAGAVGSALGNLVHQTRASRRESAATGKSPTGIFVKHLAVEAGVNVATNLAGAKALKHTVKASILAGEGSVAAAKGFHSKVKPYTSKMAENRKFKRAKWVKPETRKFLK